MNPLVFLAVLVAGYTGLLALCLLILWALVALVRDEGHDGF